MSTLSLDTLWLRRQPMRSLCVWMDPKVSLHAAVRLWDHDRPTVTMAWMPVAASNTVMPSASMTSASSSSEGVATAGAAA